MITEELHEKLVIGAKIELGPEYIERFKWADENVFTLVEGFFEHDNGLYCTTESCPSRWDEGAKEYDSIYHLFGNDLEDWMDCKIIK